MTANDRSLRSLQMSSMRKQGKTYKEIGIAFGVTAERVRQILSGISEGVELEDSVLFSLALGGAAFRVVDGRIVVAVAPGAW